MARKAKALTDAEVAALIRSRPKVTDAKVLTYTKPRGPVIRGGPHGWKPTGPKE